MTWYDYDVTIANFVSDLATKAIAEGWVRQEVGYNTIYPAGYSGFLVLFESLYGSIYQQQGSSSANFTHITVHTRATYDSGNHRPNTSANGGDARFRMIETGTDYSASATKNYHVKGWIDSTHIAIDVMADNTCTGWGRHFIYVGEVEAVDAAANTCVLNSTEELNDVGQSIPGQSYAYWYYENHFIHVLGDNTGLYPWAYGIGVSQQSNKVRPSPVYLWRREAGTDKPHQLYYRIPTSILRVTLVGGIEGENDTFTDTTPDPDQTFKRMLQQSAGTKGCEQWHKWKSMMPSDSEAIGYVWVRSA